MKQIVIIGTTMFSAELAKIIGGAICYTVDNRYNKEKTFCGLPVYPFEDIHNCVDIENTEFVLGIGYSQMNQHRERKYWECKERGFSIHTYISPKAIIYADSIGEGSIIMPGAYIGPYSNVGIGNVIRANCTLSHHETIGNFNWIADGCTFGGGVTMTDNCFVGLGSTIRNEIRISERTFIGAHTFVAGDTIPNSVMLGVPAHIRHDIQSLNIIDRV